MTKNQSKCLGLVLFLFGLTLNLSSAEAQISVYEKLTGSERLFSNELALAKSAGLTIKIKAGYDDLLRKSTQFEEIKFVRWTYGAAVDWKTSANQSWQIGRASCRERV